MKKDIWIFAYMGVWERLEKNYHEEKLQALINSNAEEEKVKKFTEERDSAKAAFEKIETQIASNEKQYQNLKKKFDASSYIKYSVTKTQIFLP